MGISVEEICDKFKEIREAAVVFPNDDGDMWDAASVIRSSANEVLRLLPPLQEAEGAEVHKSPDDGHVQEIFHWAKNVKTGQLQLTA